MSVARSTIEITTVQRAVSVKALDSICEVPFQVAQSTSRPAGQGLGKPSHSHVR
jgi:hypothetical protein